MNTLLPQPRLPPQVAPFVTSLPPEFSDADYRSIAINQCATAVLHQTRLSCRDTRADTGEEALSRMPKA